SAYVASKFAIRGLAECLREEVRDAPGIHVCTLFPATVDTPMFRRAGNYTPWPVRAVPPVYSAALVARAMVETALAPRAEIVVGGFGWLVQVGALLAPRIAERVVALLAPLLQFVPRRNERRPNPGNLHHGVYDAWAVDGGWRRRTAYSRAPERSIWMRVRTRSRPHSRMPTMKSLV